MLGKDKLQLTGHDWNIKILCPSSDDEGGEGEKEKRVMLQGLESLSTSFFFLPLQLPKMTSFVFQHSEQNSLYLFYIYIF